MEMKVSLIFSTRKRASLIHGIKQMIEPFSVWIQSESPVRAAAGRILSPNRTVRFSFTPLSHLCSPTSTLASKSLEVTSESFLLLFFDEEESN